MKFYFDLSSEYTENIGIMELHVIPNVGSVNSEHYLRDCLRGIYKKYLPYPMITLYFLTFILVGNLAHLPEKPSVGGELSKS
jgi:hypothetical protein